MRDQSNVPHPAKSHHLDAHPLTRVMAIKAAALVETNAAVLMGILPFWLEVPTCADLRGK